MTTDFIATEPVYADSMCSHDVQLAHEITRRNPMIEVHLAPDQCPEWADETTPMTPYDDGYTVQHIREFCSCHDGSSVHIIQKEELHFVGSRQTHAPRVHAVLTTGTPGVVAAHARHVREAEALVKTITDGVEYPVWSSWRGEWIPESVYRLLGRTFDTAINVVELTPEMKTRMTDARDAFAELAAGGAEWAAAVEPPDAG